jgi:hypothetical protein
MLHRNQQSEKTEQKSMVPTEPDTGCIHKNIPESLVQANRGGSQSLHTPMLPPNAAA